MFPRTVMIGCVVLAVLRLVLAAAHEITPAEAELWLAAQRPAWGYFDHGPLAAWLVKLSSLAFGAHPLAVRVWAAPLMLGVTWVTWRLVFSLFGEKAAGWAVAVLNVAPWFNVAGILFLPASLAFALAVPALWLTWRALHRAGRWDWHWPAAGAVLGLSVLAAPEGLAGLLGFAVLLAVPRRWRGRLRRPGPWVALATALGVACPWIFWVAGRELLPVWSHWIEFARAWTWKAGAVQALSLVGLASPVILAGVAWTVWADAHAAVVSMRRRWAGQKWHDDPFDQKDGRVFLLAFVPAGVVLAAVVALRGGQGMGFAAVPGFAAVLLLTARWLETPFAPAAHRLAQNVTFIVASLWALAVVNSDFCRHLGTGWPYAHDPTPAWRGWRATAAVVDRAVADMARETGRPVFLMAGSAELAALLEMTTDGKSDALFAGDARDVRCQAPLRAVVDGDHALWPRADRAADGGYEGRDAVFVVEGEPAEAPGWLTAQFASVSRAGTVEIFRGEWPVRRLTFFACRGYRRPAW